MRSACASAHADHRSIASGETEVDSLAHNRSYCIDVGAEVTRPAQRRRLIEQPPDPGMFELLAALSLLALKLQLIITSVLLQCGLALHPPLECMHTVFAIYDLGNRDDLNDDLLNEALEAAPLPVLPGCPLLITVIPLKDGKTQLVGTAPRPWPVPLARPAVGRSSDTATLV
jgi:hypothetical protein